MKRKILLGFGLMLLVLMQGCAGTGAKEPESTASGYAGPPTRRVALLTINEPSLYEVHILHDDIPNPGVTLPGRLVGGTMSLVLQGADRTKHNYKLSEAISYWNYKVSEGLTNDIKREMKAIGYEVVVVPVTRNRARFIDKMPNTPVPVDAYIDAYVDFAGYTAIKHGQPYVPTLDVLVKVISTKNGSTTYQATLTYGGPIPVDSPTSTPADPVFNVRNFEELCGTVGCEVSPAVQGMKAGTRAVAKMLARNIK